MRDIDEITGEIIDASYRLHTRLGPGLLNEGLQRIVNSYQPTPASALRINQASRTLSSASSAPPRSSA
jgi:hypothetical protein